ncbi:MAG: hypothetical protein JXR77_10560 [Lentisphaeria bacterium]|nr:hypothetical protein [Lentisphaeria bacterium]
MKRNRPCRCAKRPIRGWRRLFRRPGRGVRLLGALLVLALPGPAVRGQSQEGDAKAREEWMHGYVKLEEGGRAEEQGDSAQALSLYRDALTAFEEVRRRHPSWNPSLLGYRITFCTQRIRRLESQVAQAKLDLGPDEMAKLVTGQTAEIATLAAENRELKQKLSLTGEALERARRESARTVSTTEEVRDLVSERARLQEENVRQQQEIEALKGEVTTLRSRRGLEEAAARLEGELRSTRERETQLEKAFDTYRRAYENVKERLNTATVERETLLRAGTELKDRLDAAREEAAADRTAAESLRNQVSGIEERRAADAQLLARARSDVERARQETEELRKEVADLRPLRDAKVTDLAETQRLATQVNELTLARTTCENALAAVRAETRGLRDQLAEMETLKRSLDETRTQRDALRQQLDEALAQRLETVTPAAGDGLPAAAAAETPTRAAEGRRADAAETAVTRLEQELAELRLQEKAARARADAMSSRDEAARRLEREAADLRRQLEAAREEVTRWKAQVDAQGARIAEAEAFGRTLAEKERVLASLTDQAGRERQELADERAALSEARDTVRDLRSAHARLQERNALLEGRAVELDAALQDSRRALEDRQRHGGDALTQLQQARELLAGAEAENGALRSRNEEQLSILKRQEAQIRDLEAGTRTLAARDAERAAEVTDLRRRLDEQAETFAREAATMKAKTEVVDGLSASLADADARIESLKGQVAVLQGDRQAFERRLADARSQLADREKAVLRLQEGLRQGSTVREGALLKQITELSSRLEREAGKRKALEEALAEATPAPTAAAVPAPATDELSSSGESERERRERERNLLVRGYLRQAVAAEKEGKPEAATWNYRKVLEHDATHKLAAQRLGLLAVGNGQDEEGIHFLKRAFRLDPDDLDTVMPLGLALLRRDDADLAISMLSRAVALEPGNPLAHRCLGIACSSLGWYDAAEVQFRRTHSLNATDGENAFNLAVLLASRKPPRLEEARSWYERALEAGVQRDPGLDQLFDPKPAADP